MYCYIAEQCRCYFLSPPPGPTQCQPRKLYCYWGDEGGRGGGDQILLIACPDGERLQSAFFSTVLPMIMVWKSKQWCRKLNKIVNTFLLIENFDENSVKLLALTFCSENRTLAALQLWVTMKYVSPFHPLSWSWTMPSLYICHDPFPLSHVTQMWCHCPSFRSWDNGKYLWLYKMEYIVILT